MAKIKLDIVTDTADGAERILFIVGETVAAPEFAKNRTVTVDGPGKYTYDYIIYGDPGGTASYEVKQGAAVIVPKQERKIRQDRRRYNGGGNLVVA